MQLISDIKYKNFLIKLSYSKLVVAQLKYFNDILKRNNKFSKNPAKPIDVIVLDPLFGFHSQGMRTIQDDRIIIRLWGKKPLMLIHELVHCYFPSKNQALHEGLADFFQYLYKNPQKTKNRYIEFIRFLLSLYDLNDSSEVFNLWKNSQNCDNTRNNLMLITRLINLLFAEYIIDFLGYETYFQLHNNPSDASIKTLFHSFSETICTTNINIPNRLKKLKLQHYNVSSRWAAFEQYGLPDYGNPMKFLKSICLSKNRKDEAYQIYKGELLLYNAWCKEGHIMY